MKTREGAPETQAFGPVPPGTYWRVRMKNGSSWVTAEGATAFNAAASLGISMGHVDSIERADGPEKPPTKD